MKKNWYILRTKPRCEKKSAIYLSKHNLEYYLPLKKEVRKWSDRVKKTQTLLIPGYIFIYTDAISKNKIFESNYALFYLMEQGKHVFLCEKDLSLIKKMEQYEGEVDLEKKRIKKGEEVEIISGPLKGLKGCALKDSDISKLYIELSIIETGFVVKTNNNRVKYLVNRPKKIKIVG